MCAQQSGIGPDNSVARPSQSNEGSSDSVDASQSRRRGRPPGSITLTDQVAGLIVAYIQGGAFDHVAAEAAGISPRTFRDWMARGEGTHPERDPTPKLRRFAAEVRRAKAQARLGAEVRMYRENPKYWLSHAAKTTAEMEGWSELTPAQESSMRGDTIDDRIRAARDRMIREGKDPDALLG